MIKYFILGIQNDSTEPDKTEDVIAKKLQTILCQNDKLFAEQFIEEPEANENGNGVVKFLSNTIQTI